MDFISFYVYESKSKQKRTEPSCILIVLTHLKSPGYATVPLGRWAAALGKMYCWKFFSLHLTIPNLSLILVLHAPFFIIAIRGSNHLLSAPRKEYYTRCLLEPPPTISKSYLVFGFFRLFLSLNIFALDIFEFRYCICVFLFLFIGNVE